MSGTCCLVPATRAISQCYSSIVIGSALAGSLSKAIVMCVVIKETASLGEVVFVTTFYRICLMSF